MVKMKDIRKTEVKEEIKESSGEEFSSVVSPSPEDTLAEESYVDSEEAKEEDNTELDIEEEEADNQEEVITQVQVPEEDQIEIELKNDYWDHSGTRHYAGSVVKVPKSSAKILINEGKAGLS